MIKIRLPKSTTIADLSMGVEVAETIDIDIPDERIDEFQTAFSRGEEIEVELPFEEGIVTRKAWIKHLDLQQKKATFSYSETLNVERTE